jgi:hypothetical protein
MLCLFVSFFPSLFTGVEIENLWFLQRTSLVLSGLDRACSR